MLGLHMSSSCRLAWPVPHGLECQLAERLLGLLATSPVEPRWMSQWWLVLANHHLPWHPVKSSIGLP